jgi:hypothetical protein
MVRECQCADLEAWRAEAMDRGMEELARFNHGEVGGAMLSCAPLVA